MDARDKRGHDGRRGIARGERREAQEAQGGVPFVMAGHSRPKDGVLSPAYVPAIHVFAVARRQDVDARPKAGHDGREALHEQNQEAQWGFPFVMAGLVPAIHVFVCCKAARRGCPRQARA